MQKLLRRMPPLEIENFPSAFFLEPSKEEFFTVSSYSPMAEASLIHSEFFRKKKTLLVFPSQRELESFKKASFFLDPTWFVRELRGHQMYPSEKVLSNEKALRERLSFCYEAQKDAPHLFVTTICDLSQKTLPLETFKKKSFYFEVETSQLPTNLSSFFESLGYTSAPFCESVGSFALRGGMFDIFSPA